MFRFGPIGDFLRWILELIYRVIPNYGWAVIVFTLVIRLCLLPFDIKSKRSLKRTAAIQPQLDAINKKYANDREKLAQKQQELYRREKINPMSGCLPMLLSMLILFPMFYVMREISDEEIVYQVLSIKEALEAGIQDFKPALQPFLWIKNVFQPDSFMSTVLPASSNTLATITKASGQVTTEMIEAAKAFLDSEAYQTWALANGNEVVYSGMMLFWTINIPRVFNGLFILPLLSAASQFFSSKLLNAGQKPQNEQAQSTNKMMQWFFPLFSLWICATSTAGFALYWVASNLIQIVEQFLLGKWIDHSDKKKNEQKELSKEA